MVVHGVLDNANDVGSLVGRMERRLVPSQPNGGRGYLAVVHRCRVERGSNQSAANQYARHVRLMPPLFHHIHLIATPSACARNR